MDDGEVVTSGKIQFGAEMEIMPLAAESLGVRSLATHVQTADTSILIDPGIALGFRDMYHPHPTEYSLLKAMRKKILERAQSADLIVISHYHHDHFMPFFLNYAYFWSSRKDAEKLYRQRRIWCKDIRDNINPSQQGRGYNYVRSVKKLAYEVVYADGRALKLGDTTIRFSPAVPHGESGTPLGFVIMTSVRHQDITIVHASDVQGPMVSETTEWILSQHPQVLVIAGPPTYLVPSRVEPKALNQAAEQMKRLIQKIPTIVLDHHLLRDPNWSDWVKPIQKTAPDQTHKIVSVAQIHEKNEQLLETRRLELYSEDPPSQAFLKWIEQIHMSQIKIPPPLEDQD